MRERPSAAVTVRFMEPGDEVAFRHLNENWIRRYFKIEDKDLVTLADPVTKIIKPGGQVFIAILGGNTVGCVALLKLPEQPGAFELAKMATDQSYQRQGIGRALMMAAIAWAREQKASRLYLETNSSLTPALKLYEAAGFRYMPPQPTPYKRADVFMELLL